ncbi:MAG: UDP-N-acetylmuramate--L-alanine ligase [Bacteroidales bacterium]|nr:UDP-N-acetylmuramate--L-alanine ligase [Bacteroidales bacterium]
MKSKISNIYFIGIGGIGMSAIARYFKACDYNVAGYDRTRSEVCTNLEEEGIQVHYDDNLNLIGSYYKDKDTTLVIYTPAIPSDHHELTFFRENGFEVIKRSEALGRLCEKKKCLAVAGTHGKTSISTITSCIMARTKDKCSAFLGGISKNFNSNLHLEPKSKNVVVEADEFDRSFLHLSPSTALISHIEADHLDIYGNYENMEAAFVEFTNKISKKGNLVLGPDIPETVKSRLRKDLNVYTYGIEDSKFNFYATNISYGNGLCIFDINTPFGTISEIKYRIGGRHNIENAVGATAVSMLNGATADEVRTGLENFIGVLRRFDIQLQTEKCVYIDDYAHHPGEISAFLSAVRQIYPQKKITAIFQPHLYTRTRDLYKDFAESLSQCDTLILLPIYPARELPIEGVTSSLIYDNCHAKEKYLCEKAELIELIGKLKPELLLTMGAGDIDRFVKPITNFLTENENKKSV